MSLALVASRRTCRRFPHNNPCIGESRRLLSRLPSTPSGAASTTTATTKAADLAWKVSKPNAIFPWRHEETNSLEWLQRGQKFGPRMPPMNRLGTAVMIHGTAANALNISWYDLPFTKWKQELADSSAWAFSQAVAGVLSNTYCVPLESIVKEDAAFEVDFLYTTTTTTTPPTGNTEKESDKTLNDEMALNVDDMIEGSLKTLYQAAHESGRQNLQITLQTNPVGAHFISCFWIPYLTRQQVKDKPAMKRTFYNMRDTVEHELELSGKTPSTIDAMTATMKELDKLARRQTKDYEQHSCVESTVVLLVLVECDEIFSVVDLETSKVIQGHEDHKIRRVNHVVRLEQVANWVMHDTQGFFVENGPWQITDWDDLLEGNIFYLGD